MTRAPKEKRRDNGNGRGADGRFMPGNPGGGRPRGVPNKVARPAREWLAEELESRRAQLLAAIDADPAMLWRVWEWTFGRPPQALDVAMSNPGSERAERVAQAVVCMLGGAGGNVEMRRDEAGRLDRIVVKDKAGKTRGVVTDGKVYIGLDPFDHA